MTAHRPARRTSRPCRTTFVLRYRPLVRRSRDPPRFGPRQPAARRPSSPTRPTYDKEALDIDFDRPASTCALWRIALALRSRPSPSRTGHVGSHLAANAGSAAPHPRSSPTASIGRRRSSCRSEPDDGIGAQPQPRTIFPETEDHARRDSRRGRQSEVLIGSRQFLHAGLQSVRSEVDDSCVDVNVRACPPAAHATIMAPTHRRTGCLRTRSQRLRQVRTSIHPRSPRWHPARSAVPRYRRSPSWSLPTCRACNDPGHSPWHGVHDRRSRLRRSARRIRPRSRGGIRPDPCARSRIDPARRVRDPGRSRNIGSHAQIATVNPGHYQYSTRRGMLLEVRAVRWQKVSDIESGTFAEANLPTGRVRSRSTTFGR